MLSVDEARERILQAVRPLAPRSVPLSAALGLTLAQDLVAGEPHPPFDNSAVDGFAVRSQDVPGRLRLLPEIAAGTSAPVPVGPGEAAPIMTGAMLPDGADACAMVEDSTREGDHVVLARPVARGENVRYRGEHLKPGEVVLLRGRPLRPPDIAMAAFLGYPALLCTPRPRVAIVSTGDELVDPGQPLGPGQIRDSNSYALEALVQAAGARPIRLGRVADDPAALEQVLRKALMECEMLITTAGVSVGEHDYVKAVLERVGGELHFWRIRMRPGKPLAFGSANGVPMFGLPGNPVSSMVGFEIFIRPALDRMMDRPDQDRWVEARLSEPVTKKRGLRTFMRARLKNGTAYPTGPQGSHILRSMVEADALLDLPEDCEELGEGTLVRALRV